MISSSRKTEILLGDSEHLNACLHIGESLPEYFDEAGLKEMRRSLLDDLLYVAIEDARVVGFITLGNEKSKKAEITWFAVGTKHQKRGAGSALLARAEVDLIGRGIKLLEVKTLAEEANYPPFEATRRFYERNGFLHVETVNPYPGWGGDPAAIYVKFLFTEEVG